MGFASQEKQQIEFVFEKNNLSLEVVDREQKIVTVKHVDVIVIGLVSLEKEHRQVYSLIRHESHLLATLPANRVLVFHIDRRGRVDEEGRQKGNWDGPTASTSHPLLRLRTRLVGQHPPFPLQLHLEYRVVSSATLANGVHVVHSFL